VAVPATEEPLHPPPVQPYPMIVAETRTPSRQACVLPRHPLLSTPEFATTGEIVIARHRMATDGFGVMVLDSGHVIAFDTAAVATATTLSRASPQGTHSTRRGGRSHCRPTAPTPRR